MIILSKNKLVTVETLELSLETQYNTYGCRYEYGIAFNMTKNREQYQGFILGLYKTEKRAREVQEEIIKTYQLSELFKYAKGQAEQAIIIDKIQKKGLEPFVYRMPKE